MERDEPRSAFADVGLAGRITSCALAAVTGAFAGLTLTAAHQAAVSLGGIEVPWGILAALALTAALLTGLRLVFQTRIVACCAAVGLLGAAAVLAGQTAGGTVIVPANPAGYAWTFGPVLIALVVLAWPQARPRRDDKLEVPGTKGPDHP